MEREEAVQAQLARPCIERHIELQLGQVGEGPEGLRLYRVDADRCELRKMYLLSAFQWQGLGHCMMRDALAIAREIGDRRQVRTHLSNLGVAHWSLGQVAEAITYYERALAIYKDQGDTDRASRMLMKLGLTYHSAFDYERSGQAYQVAFVLLRGRDRVTPDTK